MKEITLNDFLGKYKGAKVDLVRLGLINAEDVKELRENEKTSSIEKLQRLFEYLPFTLIEPSFLVTFLFPQVLRGLGLISPDEKNDLLDNRTVKNANIKTSLVTAFNPKSIFEIGTYFGWAAACFKFATPDGEIYTINPKETRGANNPLEENSIGYFFKKKNLRVNQIWGDSTTFDYSTLPEIDVVYIDGNHKFEFVYKDLMNSAKTAKKAIILDDYIPRDKAKKLGLPYAPWNHGVVTAVDKYLSQYSSLFSECYSIENSPYCVLTKI